PTFNGELNATVSKQWIRDLEKIFATLECTDEQKLNFVVYRLWGDATYWWERTEAKWESCGLDQTWDKFQKIVQLNAKAKHIIICAINSNEFNRVSSCVLTKEMWDKLQVTYEGTNQVKEDNISMLVHEYEMFTMQYNKDIKTMFTRFTNMTNASQAFDRVYTNSDMVRKILKCLPKAWMPKVTAIEEAKDLNTLPLEDLLGSLMTNELSILKRDDE
ncbi:UBN2 domain-containing protein, partial [Cephalotus follicularis]